MSISIDYLAGFIDGEGCFNISKPGAYRGTITIGSTDKEALAIIELALVGYKIVAPITRRVALDSNEKDYYCLRISKVDSVHRLCKYLEGKLLIKERQRKLMSEFIKLKVGRDGKHYTEEEVEKEMPYYYCMRTLNKKGKNRRKIKGN